MKPDHPDLILQLELEGDDLELLVRSAFTMLSEAGLQVRISETEPVAGTKGAPLDFSTILLAAITTGTIKALIEMVRCLIERTPAIKVRISHGSSTVEIDASKVSRKEEVELIEKLLGGARA